MTQEYGYTEPRHRNCDNCYVFGPVEYFGEDRWCEKCFNVVYQALKDRREVEKLEET